MPKYNFDELTPLDFESLVKALIDDRFRTGGSLTQFGPGRDGGREATWEQPSSHPDYRRPKGAAKETPRRWIFQAKFHNFHEPRSRLTSSQVVQDINTELHKVTNIYKAVCDSYVMVTNAPLSGVHQTGGKDTVARAIKRWSRRIADIQVWDAADLSAMLDAAPGVRTTVLEKILPGDILAELLSHAQREATAKGSALRAYLKHVIQSAGAARTDEAGDDADRQLRLEDVFIDLSVVSVPVSRSPKSEPAASVSESPFDFDDEHPGPALSASSALLAPPSVVTLLEAGPGYGKSTICQFLAILNAARILDPAKAERLSTRMMMYGKTTYRELDAQCSRRFPFRIELRRYADARSQRVDSIAAYIAEELINPAVDTNFTREDVYSLAAKNPCLVILDGLDEVPNAELRNTIVKDADTFMRRASAMSDSDILMIVSTRPQGYHGEFDTLAGAKYLIQDLSPKEFAGYRDAWLSQRVFDVAERAEAKERVDRGMKSPEVARLAATLLQATVILTIARNKHDIPHERSRLFSRYVDVIFLRETIKNRLVKEYESELRQLHQEVAYAMHCAMEGGEAGSIGLDAFRNCVVKVWLRLRGTEPQGRGLRPLIEQLIDVAKDRLVFLRGEGPEQDHIGFLLSSFREFFSALYLANHEEADRQKVFEALFEREWHWENVLLFYAGLQGAADQRSWLYYLRERDDSTAAEQVWNAVRFRALLGKLLPELRGLTRKTYETAVREVFALESLWAWSASVWMRPILESVRNGLGTSVAVDSCLKVLQEGSAAPNVAIGACAAIVSNRHSEWARVEQAILAKSSSPAVREAALKAAVRHGFSMSLPGTTAAEWHAALEAERFYGEELEVASSSLPYRTALELYVRFYWTAVRWLDGHKLIAALSGSLEHRRPPFGYHGTGRGFALHTYLSRSKLSRDGSSLRAMLEQMGVMDHPDAQYLLALDGATRSGTDSTAFSRAIAMGDALALGEHAFFSGSEQLGPGPSEFRSVAEWVEFRRAVSRLHSRVEERDELETAFGAGAAGPRRLAVLLFHPRAWSQLVELGAGESSAVTALRKTALHDVANASQSALSLGSVAIVYGRHWEVSEPHEYMLASDLVNAGVAVADTHGIRSLGPAASMGAVSLLRFASHGARSETRRALEMFDGDCSQSREWRAIALINALCCDGVAVDEIEAYWRKRAREQWPLLGRIALTAKHVVARVCESATSEPFKLHVLALLGEPYDGPAAEDLAKAAIQQMRGSSSEHWHASAWRALRCLPWTTEETQYWIDRAGHSFVSPYVSWQLAERIHAPKEPAQRWVAPLDAASRLLEHASALPHLVSRAALLRYATLRRADTPRLCERNWVRR